MLYVHSLTTLTGEKAQPLTWDKFKGLQNSYAKQLNPDSGDPMGRNTQILSRTGMGPDRTSFATGTGLGRGLNGSLF